jgi:hypothetical protein
VPRSFTLLQAPYCGRDVERILVDAAGAYYNEHYKPAGIPQATTPDVSVKRLSKLGFRPILDNVSVTHRIEWLNSYLWQQHKPIALWTRATSKPLMYVPHYLHVVAVLDLEPKGYKVLDARKSAHPRTSEDVEYWSEADMRWFWRNTPFSKTVPALHLA